MATKNLNLPQFDGSDYISVEPFNTIVEILDKLGKDYVVDTGKKGEWWYRKWSSGRAECGIDSKTFARCKNDILYGGNQETGLWRTGYLQVGVYPLQFKSTPTCLYSFIRDEAWQNTRSAILITKFNGTTSSAPDVALCDPNKHDCQLTIGVFATGWWK